MGLIENKYIKMLSNHKLSDGHTISHKGHFSIRRSFFLKPDIIANLKTQSKSHFKGDSLSQRNCTYPSRLSNNDFIITIINILWDLCCLAAASLSTNYCDIVLSYRVYDLLFVLKNRQALLLLLKFRNHYFLCKIL